MASTRAHSSASCAAGALALAALTACSFESAARRDAGPDDAPVVIDASPCVATGTSCDGDVLRTCAAVGSPATETTCDWGCLDTGGPPRCGQLAPSGGVLMAADLAESADLTAASGSSTDGEIDTGTGAITGVRGAGTGVINGIQFEKRTLGGREVAVFRVKRLELSGSWRIRGSLALAIAASERIELRGAFDARAQCSTDDATPGGFAGGAAEAPGTGPGAGGAGAQTGGGGSAGGGGGHAGTGGVGGSEGGSGPRGGDASGTAEITSLVGGSGGGGGGSPAAARGGSGGAAIQLAANDRIEIDAASGLPVSGINAGGCGGRTGGDGAGGGGAGGTILVEAATIELKGAQLVANGGGGGGGGAGQSGNDGAWGSARTSGGTGGTGGNGNGGQGGAGAELGGLSGTNANRAGGGGGAAGRIRINTRSAANFTRTNEVISPALPSAGATHGAAAVR